LSDSFYDPGLFFDDDGKIYVAYGIDNLRIAELDADFNKVPGTDQLVFSATFRNGLEGSHLYKINGYYYIYATYGGWPAFQVALRSENIYGPYEEKKLIDDDNIHQGALIQTQSGEWWTMLFYDKGAFGRFPNLQPVTWIDSWPEIGVDGKGVTTYKKPDVGKEFPIASLPTNDNFRNYMLGLQWGWSHNPDNSKWSLIERPDFLRLKTVNVTDSLHLAKNTLTQRILGYPNDLEHSYGTIKLEIDSMMEGDIAGLAVFQDPYAYIGVKMENGQKKLVMYIDGVETFGSAVSDSVIFLRAVASYHKSKAAFYYSFDNETYTKLGADLDMKYKLTVFTGNKFCIFNFATQQTGGFVDVDWFTTEENFSEDQFYSSDFNGYSEEALTLVDLEIDNAELYLLTGSSASLNVNAVYADGHSQDVSIGATYSNYNPEILQIHNGQLIAKADGETHFSVSYKDPLGNVISKNIHLVSSTFPLNDELFNPSIFATGTFDEETRILQTGQYGFGGWLYNNGVDLSGYKYLVAKLGSENKSSVSFRLFDGASYWGSPAIFPFNSNREVVLVLNDVVKEDGTPLNSEHIYIAGFWSNGSNPFVIDSVFVTNSNEYAPRGIYVNDFKLKKITTLDGLNYFAESGPSESQSLIVSGFKLDGDITITAPENFEISTDSIGDYVSNITLSDNEGTVDETIVFVRLKSGLEKDTYSGDIIVNSDDVASKRIALSGMVEYRTNVNSFAKADLNVISTRYFSITGQRVDNIENERGLFVKMNLMSDGSTQTSKIIKY
jgi:hypothetical protein